MIDSKGPNRFLTVEATYFGGRVATGEYQYILNDLKGVK